jgi:hypothetical protein
MISFLSSMKRFAQKANYFLQSVFERAIIAKPKIMPPLNSPKIQVLQALSNHAKMLMQSPDADLATAAAEEHAALAEKLAVAMRAENAATKIAA